MAKYPEGYKRCDNRLCRDGWVWKYTANNRGRLEQSGRTPCVICKGAGSQVDPKYIRRLRQEADYLEKQANKLIGKGQEEKVRRFLNAVSIKRQKADQLERNL